MSQPDDAHNSDSRSNLPVTARNFTTPEMEAVIQRAVELQAGSAARTEDGVSEVELVRIGQELGLDAAVLRRAMAEVRSRPPEVGDKDVLISLAGARTVRVSRIVRFPADRTSSLLERYLCETELMVAQRRYHGRIRYELDSSIGANVTRMARGFQRAYKPLKVQKLDVAVSAIDAESCHVEFTADLSDMRAGLIGGVLGSSTSIATAWAIVVWATAIVDPLMLAGIPLVAGSWAGTRAIYGSIRTSTQEKLESLLDRVEHDDLD